MHFPKPLQPLLTNRHFSMWELVHSLDNSNIEPSNHIITPQFQCVVGRIHIINQSLQHVSTQNNSSLDLTLWGHDIFTLQHW